MNHLTKEVRVLLFSLNQFIKKMPQNKIPKTQQSIKDIINVPNPDSEASLQKILKNLQYKYNFLKIAYPSILTEKKNTPPDSEEESRIDLQLKFDYNLYWNSITEEKKNSDSSDKELNKKSENQQEHENEQKSGTYIMKDGKLVKGEAKRRSLVDFSNWVAAHVDPEDLKKHRELLDRQHFRGPMWEGKKIPSSILDEKNPMFNMDVQPEINPNLENPKKEAFETVKR